MTHGRPQANLDEEPAHGGHDDEVVVDARSNEQDEVTDRLERLKFLPTYGDGKDPDEDGAHTVEDHSCRSAHGLGDCQSGEVKESDAYNETDRGQEEQR